MDWTKEEVSLIVADYFDMLQAELKHKKYNKTTHRNTLSPKLNKRTDGSIEFKHQNISAALINMGFPYIDGYKPRFRYQKELLEKEISNYFKKNRAALEKDFENFVVDVIPSRTTPTTFYRDFLEDAPKTSIVEEEKETLYHPSKINYLEREQGNRLLGEQGEKFAIEFEKMRLIEAGKENYADSIEWVSKEVGDGIGYDLLSKNINGTDRFIEVKTTKLAKETPIYFSRREMSFALKEKRNFYLYRVFSFDKDPKLFIRSGSYQSFCKAIPQNFKGYF